MKTNSRGKAGEREFLFERKHWNLLLKKIAPSTRIKINRHILFRESLIIVGPEGEDQSVKRTLTLDLSATEDAAYFLNEDDICEIEKAIGDALIATLTDLRVFPKDATVGGEPVYQEDEGLCADMPNGQYGYVYFIRNQDLFKIGITADLKRRMEELKPDEILNVVRCLNFKSVEKDLHSLFRDSRVPQTEYFRLDPQQVSQAHRLIVKLADF